MPSREKNDKNEKGRKPKPKLKVVSGGRPARTGLEQMVARGTVPSCDYRGLHLILEAEGWELRYNSRMERCEYREAKGPGREEGKWEILEEKGNWLSKLRSDCAAHWRHVKKMDKETGGPSPDDQQPKYVMSAQRFWDDVVNLSYRKKVDPFKDWYGSVKIEGLDWSEEKCVDILVGALAANFGDVDKDDHYHRWVAAVMWVGILKRAMEPGCFARTYPVLVSDAKCGKTEWMQNMLPEGLEEYIVERLPLTITKKELKIAIRGKVLAIMDEMEGMNNADARKLKGLLTDLVDTERGLWQANVSMAKRSCFFLGNANIEDKPFSDMPALLDRLAALTVTRKKGLKGKRPLRAYLRKNRTRLWKAAKILYEVHDWDLTFTDDKKIKAKRDAENAKHVYEPDLEEKNAIDRIEVYEGVCEAIVIAEASGYVGWIEEKDGDRGGWRQGKATANAFHAALRKRGFEQRRVSTRKGKHVSSVVGYRHPKRRTDSIKVVRSLPKATVGESGDIGEHL